MAQVSLSATTTNRASGTLYDGDFVDLTDDSEEQNNQGGVINNQINASKETNPKKNIVIHDQKILTQTNPKPSGSGKTEVPSCGFLLSVQNNIVIEANDKVLEPSPVDVRQKKFPVPEKVTESICSDDDDVILVQSTIPRKEPLAKRNEDPPVLQDSRSVPEKKHATQPQVPFKVSASPVNRKTTQPQVSLKVATSTEKRNTAQAQVRFKVSTSPIKPTSVPNLTQNGRGGELKVLQSPKRNYVTLIPKGTSPINNTTTSTKAVTVDGSKCNKNVVENVKCNNAATPIKNINTVLKKNNIQKKKAMNHTHSRINQASNRKTFTIDPKKLTKRVQLLIPMGVNNDSNKIVANSLPEGVEKPVQQPQITIQSVYSVPDEEPQTSSTDDVICLSDEENTETTPTVTTDRNKQNPQTVTIEDLSPLVDPSKATESIRDICETVTAVATISASNDTEKPVYYLLCPINTKTGLPNTQLTNNRKVQQVLALVPKNSELANSSIFLKALAKKKTTHVLGQNSEELLIPPLVIPKQSSSTTVLEQNIEEILIPPLVIPNQFSNTNVLEENIEELIPSLVIPKPKESSSEEELPELIFIDPKSSVTKSTSVKETNVISQPKTKETTTTLVEKSNICLQDLIPRACEKATTSSEEQITLNNLLGKKDNVKYGALDNASHSIPNRSLHKNKVKIFSTSTEDDGLFKAPYPHVFPPRLSKKKPPYDPISVEHDLWHKEKLGETIKIESPSKITPVDVNAIINQGKKPHIKSKCRYELMSPVTNIFKGFWRVDQRNPGCLQELRQITKSEERTLRLKKEKIKQEYESNFVACGGNSDLFLPEEKPEDEDLEDLPTISEVISKVNEEVLQIKQKREVSNKKKEEALDLIKKGLELIQSWSAGKDFDEAEKSYSDVTKARRQVVKRGRTKRLGPPVLEREDIAVPRERTKPAILSRKVNDRRSTPVTNETSNTFVAASSGEVIPKRKHASEGDAQFLKEMKTYKRKPGMKSQKETDNFSKQIMKRRRYVRKNKDPNMEFRSEDNDLFVVKRVDIIKNNAVPKRR